MSLLWSKVLESLVSEVTLQETRNNWKSNQHGGTKCSSTDHVIIEPWDCILRALDRSNNNKAVVFTALDFSKSFSRCSHQEILRAYQDVGASNWCIKMHAAFLKDRSMSVKLGTTLSDQKKVTGGAVQGSVLGVLDHNVVLNNLDDDLLSVYIAKYVDDMTIIDTVENSVPTVVDDNHSRPIHIIALEKSQNAFRSICKKSSVKGLKINDQKTQLLSVSSAFYKIKKAIIKDSNNNPIESSSSVKMLGYTLSLIHI